jgi:hypothetical protein
MLTVKESLINHRPFLQDKYYSLSLLPSLQLRVGIILKTSKKLAKAVVPTSIRTIMISQLSRQETKNSLLLRTKVSMG